MSPNPRVIKLHITSYNSYPEPLSTIQKNHGAERAGMLRQDLTGRCVGPASCEEDAALTAEDITNVMGISGLMGVSKNRGTPKWMVYNGKPY